MSDSCNSGGSDDGSGKGNDWEVVSLSLSSHPLSASSNRQRNGGGGDAFASALNSEFFFCSPDSPSESGRLSLDNVEEWPSVVGPAVYLENKKKTERTTEAVSQETPAAARLNTETFSATEGSEREDHGKKKDAAALSPELARSCASQMQEFSGMDWLEPMVPVDYEQDEIGSASIFYGLDSDSKAGTEPDYRQAGPLLASCLSSPSSPTIVSRVSSMQWVLGDEVFQGHIDGGDDESKAPSCLVEDEMPSLAGLERESFGENSGLESPDSGTGRGQRKMVPEDTKGSGPLLGDGCDDQTYEVWWKRWAALWYMQARQANTIWSIALAATVMGLVIIGHRWQHERCQNQQLRLQLCSKDEKISQLVFQIARLKEALSGRRHVPVLRTSSSYSSFLDRV